MRGDQRSPPPTVLVANVLDERVDGRNVWRRPGLSGLRGFELRVGHTTGHGQTVTCRAPRCSSSAHTTGISRPHPDRPRQRRGLRRRRSRPRRGCRPGGGRGKDPTGRRHVTLRSVGRGLGARLCAAPRIGAVRHRWHRRRQRPHRLRRHLRPPRGRPPRARRILLQGRESSSIAALSAYATTAPIEPGKPTATGTRTIWEGGRGDRFSP